MRTIRWLTKTFVGWHTVKVFALPVSDRSVIYVPTLVWWFGWEPCRLAFGAVPVHFSILGPSDAVWLRG